MFDSILHLSLNRKFYFSTKNHFLISNYNNNYIYFNITIELALYISEAKYSKYQYEPNCDQHMVLYVLFYFDLYKILNM